MTVPTKHALKNNMALLCKMNDEAWAAFNDLKNSKENNIALILKCVKSRLSVEVEYQLNAATPESIAEELLENSPRFIIYRFTVDLDGKHHQQFFSFIYYSPNDIAEISIRQMYSTTKSDLYDEMKNQHKGLTLFEIHELKFFEKTQFQTKVVGLKGQSGDGILTPQALDNLPRG